MGRSWGSRAAAARARPGSARPHPAPDRPARRAGLRRRRRDLGAQPPVLPEPLALWLLDPRRQTVLDRRELPVGCLVRIQERRADYLCSLSRADALELESFG